MVSSWGCLAQKSEVTGDTCKGIMMISGDMISDDMISDDDDDDDDDE